MNTSAGRVPGTEQPVGRSTANKVGIAISALIGAFLAFDAVAKLLDFPQMKAGAEALGFPAYQSLVIGIVLAVCVVVYAIPRTAVLGALGITAYLGGAVTANMRVEAPLLTHTLFAALFGAWLMGDRLGPAGWAGCALMLASIVAVQLLPRASTSRATGRERS